MQVKQLGELLERYDLVASDSHHVVFYNGSATFKTYYRLDSGKCIEQAVNTSYPPEKLKDPFRWAVQTGKWLLAEYLADKKGL
jgi:hypothetical protein